MTDGTPESDADDDEGVAFQNAHDAALISALGTMEETVLSSPIPFFVGGPSGVAEFRHHLDGTVWATIDMISAFEDSRPQPNRQGLYELMIAHRTRDEHGAQLISTLAPYAFEDVLNPGDTMEIGPAAPEGATISAFLFQDYARFEVEGIACGLLLCLGITGAELAACRAGRRKEVEASLAAAGVTPFTDWQRESVI